MLKTITNIVANPKLLLIKTLVGATLIHYIEDLLMIALQYIMPTILAIIADLWWGLQAAKCRNERRTPTKAIRRTVNKFIGYSCWILFSASIGITYHYPILPAIMMSIVFVLEGSSCLNNILEKRGKKISIEGVLALIGRKTNNEGLEDVIEDIDKKQTNK